MSGRMDHLEALFRAHSGRVYAMAVRAVGDACLVWASDYPHTDATFPGAVKETLEILAELPPESRERVLSENARRLYRLPKP